VTAETSPSRPPHSAVARFRSRIPTSTGSAATG
jgi:hypothetical protein